MSITNTWDDEAKTIIRIDYNEGWTWDDFEAAQIEVGEMLGSVEHEVDSVVMLNTGSTPQGILAKFSNVAASPVFTYPNSGVVVVTGARGFIGTLADLFLKIQSQTAGKITMASTLEEAYEVIAERRRVRRS